MATERRRLRRRATLERTVFPSSGDLALDFANSVDSLAHRRAVDLRDTLFALFSAVAERRPLPADDLARLDRLAHEASKRRALIPSGNGATWERQADEGELDSMLWPVVEAAALLLTSDRVARIRVCEGENCSRLFIDNSRRQNRRWCDMATCGNRAKARRHYARTAQGTSRTRSVASPSRSRQRARAATPPASPVRTRPTNVRDAIPPEPSREPEAHEDDGFVWL
jgi:predicted RNA-binding Zn ribbon-like protein